MRIVCHYKVQHCAITAQVVPVVFKVYKLCLLRFLDGPKPEIQSPHLTESSTLIVQF